MCLFNKNSLLFSSFHRQPNIGDQQKAFHFHNVTFYVCYPYPDEWGTDYRQSMVLTRFVVYFAAPLLVIAIFYALMAHHLIRSARDMPGEMHGAVRQVRKSFII